MRIQRDLSLNERVFDVGSITKLIELATSIYPKEIPEDKDYLYDWTLNIAYSDGTIVRFDAPAQDLKALLEKPILSIKLEVQTRDPFRTIEIDIKETDYKSDLYNRIRFTSEDEMQLAHLYSQFSDAVAFIERQRSPFRNRFYPIFCGVVGLVFCLLIIKVILILSNSKTYPWWTVAMFLPVGITAAAGLGAAADRLWPYVEIQTGPIHSRNLPQKRKLLVVAFSILIIAPLGNALWDLYKMIGG